MSINKNICIIGNNNDGDAISDGGRIKIRLFKSLLEENGFNVHIIDLNNWKIRFLKIIKEIKKAINNFERIIIMAGQSNAGGVGHFHYLEDSLDEDKLNVLALFLT